MPHYNEYKCSVCGRDTHRELLLAKKVTFSGIGPGAKQVRSRTVGWICNECIEADEDYNRPAYQSAPGMQSPALERVREAERRQGGASQT